MEVLERGRKNSLLNSRNSKMGMLTHSVFFLFHDLFLMYPGCTFYCNLFPTVVPKNDRLVSTSALFHYHSGFSEI